MAAHSQLPDEQLSDWILKIEEAQANDHANYEAEMKCFKEEHKEASREQQGWHEAEMARLHDTMIELKAQVGAMSA